MTGRRNTAWCLALGLAIGLAPVHTPDVWAQAKGSSGGKKSDPNDPEVIEFEKRFAAGQAAAKANRWDAARQEFLQAFDLKPDHAPTVALLAQAEMATGRHREAAEHLNIFLEYAVGLSAQDRKIAEDLLVEAQSKLAIVTVKVDKPGAKITVDGRVLGTSPLAEAVLVDAGQQRRFEAETPDGWRGKVVQDLEPRTTPTITIPLKAPATQIIKERQTWRTPLLFTSLGVGLVGIGVGVGFTLAASSKNNEAQTLADKIAYQRNRTEELCPVTRTDKQCADLAGLQSRRDAFSAIGIAGFAVGGVGALGAVVLALTGPSKSAAPKKNAVHVLPTPGGILFTGTF
jgi:tetratricopeptide (TPR) repeat protein